MSVSNGFRQYNTCTILLLCCMYRISWQHDWLLAQLEREPLFNPSLRHTDFLSSASLILASCQVQLEEYTSVFFCSQTTAKVRCLFKPLWLDVIVQNSDPHHENPYSFVQLSSYLTCWTLCHVAFIYFIICRRQRECYISKVLYDMPHTIYKYMYSVHCSLYKAFQREASNYLPASSAIVCPINEQGSKIDRSISSSPHPLPHPTMEMSVLTTWHSGKL